VSNPPTILVFDSGLGGLTVFREVVQARPDARFVYVADDAFFPYGTHDEAALVARVRAGDEAACETLYLAYHERLWRFAYGFVHSRDIAEEIVQDVFLAVWRDRATWDLRTCARAWLYAAVRNHALNHVRHARVEARVIDAADPRGESAARAHGTDGAVGMGAPAPDAQTAVEARELDEAVAQALAALPERRRLAMVLRWKHDLSPAEIACVLDTTPGSVRVLLTRARQELSALLARVSR
jgi:RNA polymerase sigma factor (sigma-70 family)